MHLAVAGTISCVFLRLSSLLGAGSREPGAAIRRWPAAGQRHPDAPSCFQLRPLARAEPGLRNCTAWLHLHPGVSNGLAPGIPRPRRVPGPPQQPPGEGGIGAFNSEPGKFAGRCRGGVGGRAGTSNTAN